MGKKILSIVLSLCMVFAMMPIMALPTYADTVDTSGMTDFSYVEGQTYASGAVYRIGTKEALSALAEAVNDGHKTMKGVTFYLSADINLNEGIVLTFEADTGLMKVSDGTDTYWIGTGALGDWSGDNYTFNFSASTAGAFYLDDTSTTTTETVPFALSEWTPIGYYDDAGEVVHSFDGTFDGNGFTISGLYTHSEEKNQGLFGLTGYGADVTFKNIAVENGYVFGYSYVGGIVGRSYGGSMTDCYQTGSIIGTSEGNSYAGGLVGYSGDFDIAGSHHSGSVVGLGFYVGGLLSKSSINGIISDSYNTGKVSGVVAVGGIVGQSYKAMTLSNCYNTADVKGGGSHVGGISGYHYQGSIIENCYNTGNIKGTQYVGGIAGKNNPVSIIRESYNTGDVEGTMTEVGGIAGINTTSTITKCYNAGYVYSGDGNAGGITGNNTTTSEISNCYNVGLIVSYGDNAGGIAGSSDSTILNCYSAGSVRRSDVDGGIVGDYLGGTMSGNYYDIQMYTSIDPGYLPDGYGTALLTSDMTTGNAFSGWDESIWQFTTGTYPRLVGMADTDVAIVSAAPIFLRGVDTIDYESRSAVYTDFSVSMVNDVAWALDPDWSDGLSLDDSGHVTISDNGGDATLIATHGDYSKEVVLFDVIAYNISVSPRFYVFDPIEDGYETAPETSFVVTNTGAKATGDLNLTTLDDFFDYSVTTIPSIEKGESYTVALSPKIGLLPTDYETFLDISNENIDETYSVAIEITPIPVYSVAFNQTETYTFANKPVGYAEAPYFDFTLTNDGNQVTGPMTLALSGTNSDCFTLDRSSFLSMAVDGVSTIRVTPDVGLDTGTYTATIGISGDNIEPKSFDISFTVEALKTLQSITAPSDVTGVKAATEKSATALGLPETVTMVTDLGDVDVAVTWDVDSCDYDPAIMTEQTFAVSGTVALPEGVVNPDAVSLSTAINVTVDEISAKLSISTATFDRYTGSAGYRAILLNMTLSGYTFTGVYNGENELILNEDYDMLLAFAIHQSYLSTLPVGDTTLTFKFSGGKDQTLIISVVDTTPAVDIAVIEGVTPPVKNAVPVTTITETDQYTGTVTWSPDDNPFATATTYTATITLTPKTGFTLSGVTEDFFSVAGATSVTNEANSGIITALFPATKPLSSTISPNSDSFDLYSGSSNYSDISVALVLNENVLTGIYNGSTELIADTDYTVSGTTATILTSYLETLSEGDTNLTLKFSEGDDQVLTVSVSDTTPIPITITTIGGVTPPAKNAVPVTTITETDQFTGTVAWSPSDSPFAAETAYTATITLMPKGLYTLTGVGANAFSVAGATFVLNNVNSGVITAVFPATAIADSALNPKTATFDKYAGSVNNANISIAMTLNENTLSGIYNGASELIYGTDYSVTGSTVTIDKAYLSTLTTGSTPLTFKFNSGADQMLTVAVVDTTPIIDIAAIGGVTVPVKNGIPAAAITETAQYTGNISWSPNDNPFKADTVYTATITLTPKADYTLNGVTANFFTVAGASAVFNSADSGVITAMFPATALANSTINPIAANFDKYTGSADYTEINVNMTLNENTLSGIYNESAELVSGTDYSVSGSTVTLDKNYFASRANGNTTLTFKFSEGADQTLTIAVVDSTPLIDIAAIDGVTVPVKNGIPVATVTETAQYTGTVTWSPNDNPFKADTVYTATITLTPKTGYTLKGIAADFFTVTGATTVTNAADSGVITAMFPATALANSTINPIAANFDKYTGSVDYTDISVNMTLNENTLSGIYNESAELVLGIDYSVSGSTVTLDKNYFAARANGNTTLMFKFSEGADQTLTIAVADSTPTINIAAIDGVTMPVKNGIPVATIAETAQYTGTVTWSPSDDFFAPETAYMATITLSPKAGYTLSGVSANYFTVPGAAMAFNSANSGVITAMFPATALANSTLNKSTASFDRYSGSSDYVNISVAMTLNENTLSGIYNGASELIYGTDYSVTGSTVTIEKAYLATLPTGDVTLTFKFDSGADQTLTIAVADSTPTINIAAIDGVTVPVKNGIPVATVTETAQYTGTVTWSPSGDFFAPETAYTATITLTPKTGYTLNGVTANFFTVAGATTATNAADSGVITAVFPATALANSTINPATANFDQYAGSTDYADISVILTLNDNTLTGIYNGDAALASGTDYSIMGSTMTFDKNYLAALSTGNTVLTFKFDSGVDQTLTISVTDTTPVIDIAAINGITVPEKNAVPVTTINETAQYIGTVTWSPSDNLFTAGTSYTATIVLMPKAGYTLNGIPENFFTVAGATAAVNNANSGVITAIFPATAADTFGITLSCEDAYIFSAETAGYSAVSPLAVTVTNQGNQPTGDLVIALNGIGKDNFMLSKKTLSSLAVNGQNSFTVMPKDDLPVGLYAAVVTVSGDNVASKSFTVAFTVAELKTYGIALDQVGTYHFETQTVHYTSISPLSVSVTNEGNQPTGDLHLALSGADKEAFMLSSDDLSSILQNGQSGFTVSPKSDLQVGSYDATVTVSGDTVASKTFDIQFIVKEASVYSIKLNQMGVYTFPSQTVNYTTASSVSVTIDNDGNQATGQLHIALEGSDRDAFSLSTDRIDDIAKNGNALFKVKTKNDLPIGTYMATVAVTGDAVETQLFTVKFVVNEAMARGIGLSQMGTYAFDTQTVNYTTADALTVTVVNTGNLPSGDLTIGLDGSDADQFELSTARLDSIDVSGQKQFKIWPVSGLGAGFYTAEVTVAGEAIASQSFTIDFTVTEPAQTNKILLAVIPPDRITAVANGTGKTAEALGLPTQVILSTDAESVMSAVTWQVADSTYDETNTSPQTFTILGTVILPEDVVNPNQVSLNVSIEVSVDARRRPTSPTGNANTNTEPPASYEAPMTGDGTGNVAIKVNSTNAAAEIAADQGAMIAEGKSLVITMPTIEGVTGYAVGLKVADLSAETSGGSVTLNSEAGNITLPSNMFAGTDNEITGNAEIEIGNVDRNALSTEAQATIGDRPVISLSVAINGQRSDWRNENAKVGVSIPYTPTADELENPNGIVVWYVDGDNQLNCVTNGHYDAEAGMVVFETTHFSYYAVGYNSVDFKDVVKDDWYYDAVAFCAAREITSGTGDQLFSPDRVLTRGQFIVMLMNAYGIDADEVITSNFFDAGDTYYTGYLSAAKRLGIASGVGNNLFAPDQAISRQDMMTLLYHALNILNELPETATVASLAAFSDVDAISDYAREPMSTFVSAGIVSGHEGVLDPSGSATRAQIAQILYHLLDNPTQ
ncbi:S-layer homology domain-containing protein [Fusibacter paucivorans]|uniref:S-layer homology domain-containing protein n=1 Tax=Fusibacter paucivorans TaxID=76009 RepID=A0ABS5PJD2_9FIRM|nr:X2-like carbohydrate binding domain-containing protein [Fusibacter paucivorans]MBS7525235.1 S-layer homology domain-containing protein [Fusibacter paucivorans]